MTEALIAELSQLGAVKVISPTSVMRYQGSAHFSLARVHFQFEWDWPAAGKEFTRGLELDPHNAFGLSLYGAYRVLIHQDCDGGIADLREARDLDPFAVTTHFKLGVYSFHCRRKAESIAGMTRVTEMAPDSTTVRALFLTWRKQWLSDPPS
jgi:hypothetical protein